MLLQEYPDIPKSLMEPLEMVEGTYWRKYGDEEVECKVDKLYVIYYSMNTLCTA